MGEDTQELSKITKMAVLLQSLEHNEAANILKSVSPDTMIALVTELRRLPVISREQQQQIIREFSDYIYNINLAQGGDEAAQRLLEEVVGKDKADEFLGRSAPFAFLRDKEDSHIAQLLNEEQASVAAVVLASLPSGKSAAIIEELDEEKRSQVVQSLIEKRQTEPGVIQRLEQVIQRKIGGGDGGFSSKTQGEMGGPSFLAQLCQNLGQETEEAILSSVEQKSQEAAQEVRDLLFTFEDITRLDDSDMQQVLREISADELALALKQASSEVEEKITSNMSKSAKQNLEEERELMGKVKLSEVTDAQEKVVSVIRELESQEKISIEKEGEEDVYV